LISAEEILRGEQRYYDGMLPDEHDALQRRVSDLGTDCSDREHITTGVPIGRPLLL
jgi:hypothetical protein